MSRITIIPYPNCKRSERIISFLKEHEIPFREILSESPEGKLLQDQYQFRASPGIIVNQTSINPYQILVRKECRGDEKKALVLFGDPA
jgi:arsenate reductase-like glutaredoxin family protein